VGGIRKRPARPTIFHAGAGEATPLSIVREFRAGKRRRGKERRGEELETVFYGAASHYGANGAPFARTAMRASSGAVIHRAFLAFVVYARPGYQAAPVITHEWLHNTRARNVRARTDKKLFSPFTAVAQINNADNRISGIPKNTRLSRVFVI